MRKEDISDIYRENMQSIYRYCLFRTNSYQDAEDLTAEVFLKLLEHYGKIQQNRVLPWLFKVAGNLCINHKRKMVNFRFSRERPEIVQEYFQSPWEDEAVWQALKHLSLKQLQVIYLRTVEDMSFKDIAKFLSKREGAVKMTFYRGIKALRETLKEESIYVLPFRKTRSGKVGGSI